MADIELGRVAKNETTDIVVKITEFKGTVGVDIREYITSDRYTGWSKSGVRVPAEKAREIARLFSEACNQLEP